MGVMVKNKVARFFMDHDVCVCIGKDYEVFAPSHPQAVNQYVREYNYYAGDDEPEYDYQQHWQQYQEAVAREYP